MTSTEAAAARWLLTPQAVRARCGRLLETGLAGELAHFTVDPGRLAAAADYVADTVRLNYPGLAIPFHARWRHFVVDGADRWAPLGATLAGDRAERLRVRFELAVTSVLLDAGAGPAWRYRDATGRTLARSEGLAVASLELYAAGGFSSDPARPLTADAEGLAAFTPGRLAEAFQADPTNPLDGLAGRAGLIRRLGDTVAAAPIWFGDDRPRLGRLADRCVALARDGALPAADLLVAVLDALGPIWPGRASLGGRNLGDTWRHAAAASADATSGLVPFHKLSQWLAYSLVEPLEEAGVAVTEPDTLTGLAEYRNGGLMLDTGVIALRDAAQAARRHEVGSALVVEWRALTVALLDRLAPLVRERLGLDARAMPLAAVLEGGTWAAGRRLAASLRPGGAPPLAVVSDGSVF